MIQKINNFAKPIKRRLGFLTSSRSRLVITALVVGIIGTVLTLLSSAQKFEFSKNPNDVIVQYSLPHDLMAVSRTNLELGDTQPFTLYGNGLMVCGHSSPTPFLSDAKLPLPGEEVALPTARMLTEDQINSLLGEISETGYFQLNKEYYKRPKASQQERLRVSLASGDHYVLYYRDVEAPEAYARTVRSLENYCKETTTLYEPDAVTLRALKDTDPKGREIKDVANVPSSSAASIKQALAASDKAKTNAATGSPQAQLGIPEPQTIKGQEAKSLIKDSAGKAQQYVRQNNAVYEVAVEPVLPEERNTLQIDYEKIRAAAGQDGLSATLKKFLTPTAEAQSTRPIRVVLLLPASGGSTENSNEAQAYGQAVRDWYCVRTGGYCYNFQGVTTIRGTLSASQYMSGPYGPLENILDNVERSNAGTVYRDDVNTVIVPGWDTKQLNIETICGIGFLNAPLSIIDYYMPTRDSGTSAFCSLGAATAHELGHTFGLDHTSNGTVMDAYLPDCDIGYPNYPVCTLDGNQANRLAANTTYFARAGSLLPPAGSAQSTLNKGSQLTPGKYLLSPAGKYQLILQTDGNLVIYNSYSKQPEWATNTYASRTALYFALDEHLLLTSTKPDRILWSANTRGTGGEKLVMQDDGNLVMYNRYTQPVWNIREGVLPKPPPPTTNSTVTNITITGKPAVASNPDGRQEVFARGGDNQLWHKWQTSANGGWSNWHALGGQLTSNPSVGRNADGRLEVFVRGSEHSLWHIWQNSAGNSTSYSAWHGLGGGLTSDPIVGQNKDGRLEVFVRGGNNALYHMWQWSPNGGFSGWASLGGGLTSVPAVGRNADGRLEVFVRGGDNALHHMWQLAPGSGWGSWNRLGGGLSSEPVIGHNADGRLEVFIRGTDNQLWHMWQWAPNSGWSGWAAMGGQMTAEPAVGRNADGRLEVFARGLEYAQWHTWQLAPGAGWSSWAGFGGGLTSAPVVGRNADGRLEVYVRGTDARIYRMNQTVPNGGWTGYSLL